MPLLKKIDIEKSLDFFSLPQNTTTVSLKKRYRELIKLYHPDKHPEHILWSTSMMQRINEAYNILKENLTEEKPHTVRDTASDFPTSTAEQPEIKILSVSEIKFKYETADLLIENSVLTGWLQRTPKDNFAVALRNRIAEIVSLLQSTNIEGLFKNTPEKRAFAFLNTLFPVFLRATDFKKPGHFPSARNTTKYFRNFTIANRYLDSGVRQFYRYRETNKLIKYKNVPLSFLDDSIRLFSFLIPESRDNSMKKVIRARIELAGLFQARTSDKNLWNPWL